MKAAKLWWTGSALALSLALGVWLGPYALSSYHLEAGGRALDAALVPVFPDWLAPEQIVDAERLEAGVAHLHQAIRWDPRNAQVMRLLVRVYVTQGQPEAALETLQQALAVRPDNPLLYLELGNVYDSLGQAEAAIEAYETGGVGSRGVPLAVNYLKLADAKAQAGGGDVAIGLWRKAATVDPGNLYALYWLAQIHRDMGDEERAAEYEERLRYFDLNAVVVSPDARMAGYQGRAMARLVDEGIWERDTLLNVLSYQVWQFAEGVPGMMAERVLGTLLEQWPEDADILFYLAELYHRQGDLEQAEAAYKQVLEVEPEYAQAYLRLGMVAGANCELRIANCEAAAEWYERYYEMAPDDLLGLKKLTEVYEALELPEAAALREVLEARTDDRRIVVELLGVPVEDVELGPNLVENGGFEEWEGGNPAGWQFGAYLGQDGDGGLYVAGEDALSADGEAARIAALWGGLLPDGTTTYAEYAGSGFPVIDTKYLISLYYRSWGFAERSGFVFLGEYTRSNGLVLAHDPLPDSNGQYRITRLLVDGPAVSTSVMPLVRNWGVGDLWVQSFAVRQVVYEH